MSTTKRNVIRSDNANLKAADLPTRQRTRCGKHNVQMCTQEENGRVSVVQFIRASVIVAVVVASTSLPTTTWADAAKYPVKGLLKSKSNDAIPAGVSTPLLLDTEAPVTSPGSGKVLVLQQVCCFAGGVTNIQVNSSPAGAVSDSVGAQNHCFNFNPGVVIPEGTDVTVYIATGGGCTGTGIVTTKK